MHHLLLRSCHGCTQCFNRLKELAFNQIQGQLHQAGSSSFIVTTRLVVASMRALSMINDQ
jgi:hypothetical protein